MTVAGTIDGRDITTRRADEMIERASWNDAAADNALRLRCRTAPDFVRRNIDARREARGLRPLWPDLARRATRDRAAATVARLRAFLAEQSR